MPNHHPEPGTGFDRFDFSPEVRRGIAAAGFTEPRPIQEQALQAALEGRDVLGLAQTGTGKTAAFALPVIDLLESEPGIGAGALIVAPTRELATQIAEEIRMLAKFTRLRVVTIFGGVSIQTQRTALRGKPDIIVACPGRLLDLLQQGFVKLDMIETLVLDEADHMFDMGFLPDIRRILAVLPADRQNLLFSATMPPEIRRLADQILRNPHVVELSHSTPVSTIEHALCPTESNKKVGMLRKLITEDSFTSAIVFTRTKHRAKKLAEQLGRSGHRAVALQGNMSQGQRDRAMGGFRDKRYDILVATDIAARGIDIAGVSHVVNFDMPGTPDAYTHRIGRTGRSEQSGIAYTLVTRDDAELVRALERKLGKAIPRKTIDGVVESDSSMGSSRSSGRTGRSGRAPSPNRGGRTSLGSRNRPGRKRSSRHAA